jgi:hypothetical protein
MTSQLDPGIRKVLARGTVIPAHPLALTAERQLDERHQRALTRYYIAAGAAPVLKLAAEEMDRANRDRAEPLIRLGGICGETSQAVREATLLNDLGYSAGLLSLAAMKDSDDAALLVHCRTVSEILPIIGFYLQPAVGGRVLSYGFWRKFAELENIVAIKIAPFNRYQTLDVVRAVAESGRDIALYTGNDDNIALDLLTPFVFRVNGRAQERRIVGGLLGHWAVWTRRAVEFLDQCHAVADRTGAVSKDLLQRSAEITDSNAAFFDAAHNFAGCIAGLHEVLRRQGLLEGIWCLDPRETLSPGQQEEISRVLKAYPHLNDDDFVREGRDDWLRP